MSEKLQHTIEQAQVAVGYGVAGSLTSAPLWIEVFLAQAEPWMKLIMFVIGVVVGLTTIRMNMVKTKEIKGRSK